MLADVLPFGNTLWWSPAAAVSLLLLALWAAPAGWACRPAHRAPAIADAHTDGGRGARSPPGAGWNAVLRPRTARGGDPLPSGSRCGATVASVLDRVTFVMGTGRRERPRARPTGGTLSEGEADDWARMSLSRTLMHGLVVSGEVIAAFAAWIRSAPPSTRPPQTVSCCGGAPPPLRTFAGIGAFGAPDLDAACADARCAASSGADVGVVVGGCRPAPGHLAPRDRRRVARGPLALPAVSEVPPRRAMRAT